MCSPESLRYGLAVNALIEYRGNDLYINNGWLYCSQAQTGRCLRARPLYVSAPLYTHIHNWNVFVGKVLTTILIFISLSFSLSLALLSLSLSLILSLSLSLSLALSLSYNFFLVPSLYVPLPLAAVNAPASMRAFFENEWNLTPAAGISLNTNATESNNFNFLRTSSSSQSTPTIVGQDLPVPLLGLAFSDLLTAHSQSYVWRAWSILDLTSCRACYKVIWLFFLRNRNKVVRYE